ncbi:MAG: acetolactate synthase, partial [Nitrososphaerota archaeon]
KIKAFMIADAGDFGIIHLIVDDPKKGEQQLVKEGFTVSTSKTVKIDHIKNDSVIEQTALILGEAAKNIRYAYGFVSEDGCLILRTEAVEEALEILSKKYH